MKRVFLILLVIFVAIAAKFFHTRMFVKHLFGPSSMLAFTLLFFIILVLLASYLLINSAHREKLIGFWLVSISTVASFFVIDLLAGVFLISPLSPTMVPDEFRHHKLVPNGYAKFEQSEFSYVQQNNALGLRGSDVVIDKPNTTFRILVLGDSYTMGKGVADDQTAVVVLEELLNASLRECESSFQKIEILNGGIDSYAPILSYLFLSRELEILDANLVVLNMDNNDLVQEAAYRRIADRDTRGNIIGVPGSQARRPFSDHLRHWIENNLYMTRLLLFYSNRWLGHKDLSVQGVVTRANREVVLPTLEADQVDRRQQWNDLFESLTMIRDFAAQRSAKFVLTLYPWGHQVSDEEWVPGRYAFMSEEDSPIENYDEKVLALANQFDVEAISLYDAFLEYDDVEPLYFAQDGHFTVHGQRLMAEETARLLIERGYSNNWCQ